MYFVEEAKQGSGHASSYPRCGSEGSTSGCCPSLVPCQGRKPLSP